MIQAIQTPVEESNVRLQGLVRKPCPLCSHSDSMPETMIAGYQLEKCGGCGFVFMNPRCTPEHLDEIYRVRDEDELVQLYARIASPSVVDGYRHKLDIIEAIVPARGVCWISRAPPGTSSKRHKSEVGTPTDVISGNGQPRPHKAEGCVNCMSVHCAKLDSNPSPST